MTNDIITTLSTYIGGKILKQPKRIIAENEPLISSGLIDSFNLVDMALFIEDTFGVHIDDTELNVNTFDSVSQLSELINKRMK